MAHGDAWEGKWSGNWPMEWLASTLHTTSEHVLSSITLQLKCDGTRWRTGGEVKGKLANAVCSQYSSHYLGTWCIQHYYRWCAHIGCQKLTEMAPSTGRFNGLVRFARKTKSGFRACAIKFQLASNKSFLKYGVGIGGTELKDCGSPNREWQINTVAVKYVSWTVNVVLQSREGMEKFQSHFQ